MLTRKGFLIAVAVCLVKAALARAQAAPLPPGPAPVAAAPDGASLGSPRGFPFSPAPEPADGYPDEFFWSVPAADPVPEPQSKVWVGAEYLLWWIRNGPLNVPLVTTGSPQDMVPGALGQAGTSVLFGGGPLHFGTFSGLRLTGGIDLAWGLAIEAGCFGLERRSVGYSAVSDANGNPLLARPVFNNQTPGEGAYLYALPGTASGSVLISAHTRLQGADCNLGANVYQDASVSFTAFAGFRFLELDEDLNIAGTVTPLVPGFLTFLGGPADPPNSLTDYDGFKTYNRFYGGQIGGRLVWRGDRFDLDLQGKLAIGATQERTVINGISTLNTPGSPSVTNPGGLLAEPSNIGCFNHTSLGLIPELGIRVGYRLTPQFRFTVGYSILYWNRVARPGNQIDRTVNPAQVAQDPNFGNGQGDLRPLFQVRDSAFWAQGINGGVEFQF
jgi:hypothetical protein